MVVKKKITRRKKESPAAIKNRNPEKILPKNLKKNKNARIASAKKSYSAIKKQGGLSKNSEENTKAKLAFAKKGKAQKRPEIKKKIIKRTVLPPEEEERKAQRRPKIKRKIIRRPVLPPDEDEDVEESSVQSWQIASVCVIILDGLFLLTGIYLFTLDRTCKLKGTEINDDQINGNMSETTKYSTFTTNSTFMTNPNAMTNSTLMTNRILTTNPTATSEADDFVLIPEDVISDNNFECGVQEMKPNLGNDQRVPIENSWPWIARLREKRGSFYGLPFALPICAATVVSPRHVISGWHCIHVDRSAKDYVITIGDHVEQYGKWERFQIAKFRRHPFYSDSNSYMFENKTDDVVLATLQTEIQFNKTVQPACLPPFETTLEAERFCWIYYWDTGQYRSPTMQQYKVVTITEKECKSLVDMYFQNTYEKQEYIKSKTAICAKLTLLESPCLTESGGPLTCEESGKWIFYGVGSWGMKCKLHFLSGVYAAISYSMSWICCFMATISSCQDVPCDLEKYRAGLE